MSAHETFTGGDESFMALDKIFMSVCRTLSTEENKYCKAIFACAILDLRAVSRKFFLENPKICQKNRLR
jgi:hypothetical protein